MGTWRGSPFPGAHPPRMHVVPKPIVASFLLSLKGIDAMPLWCRARSVSASGVPIRCCGATVKPGRSYYTACGADSPIRPLTRRSRPACDGTWTKSAGKWAYPHVRAVATAQFAHSTSNLVQLVAKRGRNRRVSGHIRNWQVSGQTRRGSPEGCFRWPSCDL